MPKSKTLHASPDAVEHAFYDALEHADLDSFMQLWSDDDEIACIPPNGPRIVGHHAIRQVWSNILSRGPIHARPSQVQVVQGPMVSVHSLIAQIIVNDDDGQTVVVNLNVTNIFIKGPQGWRLILHHASNAPQEVASDNKPSGYSAPPNMLH